MHLLKGRLLLLELYNATSIEKLVHVRCTRFTNSYWKEQDENIAVSNTDSMREKFNERKRSITIHQDSPANLVFFPPPNPLAFFKVISKSKSLITCATFL